MCPNRMCATQHNLGTSVRKTVAVGPWQTWSLLAPLMTSFAVFLNFTFLYSLFSSFFLSSPRRISRLVSFMLSLHLQLSSALMFDAVHVVVGAVQELNRSQEIEWSLWAARLHSSGSTAPVSWTTCAWYVSPWLRRLQPFSDCCVWGL